jgi:hypothetical protein
MRRSFIVLAEGPVSEYPLAYVTDSLTVGGEVIKTDALPLSIKPSPGQPIAYTIIEDTPENRRKYKIQD